MKEVRGSYRRQVSLPGLLGVLGASRANAAADGHIIALAKRIRQVVFRISVGSTCAMCKEWSCWPVINADLRVDADWAWLLVWAILTVMEERNVAAGDNLTSTRASYWDHVAVHV